VDAYRAVVDKRDQRYFLPRALPEPSLQRILHAARMTGSSKDSEPNRLIVMRERSGHPPAVGPLGSCGCEGFDSGRAAD